MRTTALFFISIVAFSPTHAQSLGEVAKRQRDKASNATEDRSKSSHQKVWTNDDFSSTPTPSATPSAPTLQDRIASAEKAISQLEDKTSRQLGNDVVGDVQFPGRIGWEGSLHTKKERVVAAAKAVMAVAKSKSEASAKIIDSAMYDFDLEMVGYNKLRVEGITKAADWEKQTRK
jgi:hypothetical protein